MQQRQELYTFTLMQVYRGHVDATAIVPTLQLRDCYAKRTEFMGKSTTFTVYAAELEE
jgi:hypothetical protein